MKSLKTLISYHEDIFSEFKFSDEMLKKTFKENISTEYPLLQIDDTMFNITQHLQWNYKIVEQELDCEIKLTTTFYKEIEETYPEALI